MTSRLVYLLFAAQIEQPRPQRVIFEKAGSVQHGVQMEVEFPLSFAPLSG